MGVLLYYLGIVLLLLSILYTGRQVNIYIRMKRHIGKRLSPLTPGRKGIKLVLISGAAFVLLLIIVTIQYLSKGYELSSSYTVVLVAVIFSVGRFLLKISEIREEGIMGNLQPIPYNTIKSFKTEETGKRILIRFLLKDGREFVAAVVNNDKDEVLSLLKSKL